MNIALFGGAFDPPHLGHQNIVTEMLARHIVDEIWYVPVKTHHFGKKMSPDQQRVEMLRLIVQPKTRIEEFELHQEGINYTYDTLEFLAKQHPQHTFSWIIGSDNLGGFHRWLELDPELLKYRFYVYPRTGFPFEPLYEGMEPLRDFPEVNISSTDIRARLQTGKEITSLVAPKVEQYIFEQKLYR